MRHFNCVHARIIQCLGNRHDMIEPIHVADGVHAIAQRNILNIELIASFDVELAAHAAILRAARSSPVALAAAVIMSRLPE